jgi:hypothetical protein
MVTSTMDYFQRSGLNYGTLQQFLEEVGSEYEDDVYNSAASVKV